MKNIVMKGLLILIGIQVLVLLILIGNVVFSIYDDKVEIVDKDESLSTTVDNVTNEINKTEPKEEIILPVEEDKIDESLVKDDAIYREEQKKEEIINIVLTGMDARAYETKSRSDSIILLSYNTKAHTVKMISFLRDTWVYLPERGWGRINSATAYGGVGLLINTLNENFDLDIQNYVQIKFEDFKKVIDILGGIDVVLTQSEIDYINYKLHTDDNDWKNDVKAKPGIVHLNGVQTLWHCRNRTVGDGDFSRTDRQRDVLTLLIDKAMSMPITKLSSLIYEFKDYVNTNVPITTLIDIAEDALISRNITVESYSIPFEGMFKYANKNGASVIDVNLYDTAVKLHEILGLDTDNVEVIRVKDTNNYSKAKKENTVVTPPVETPPVEEAPPIVGNPEDETIIEIPMPEPSDEDISMGENGDLIEGVPPMDTEIDNMDENISEGLTDEPIDIESFESFEEEDIEGGLGNPKDGEFLENSDIGVEITE